MSIKVRPFGHHVINQVYKIATTTNIYLTGVVTKEKRLFKFIIVDGNRVPALEVDQLTKQGNTFTKKTLAYIEGLSNTRGLNFNTPVMLFSKDNKKSFYNEEIIREFIYSSASSVLPKFRNNSMLPSFTGPTFLYPKKKKGEYRVICPIKKRYKDSFQNANAKLQTEITDPEILGFIPDLDYVVKMKEQAPNLKKRGLHNMVAMDINNFFGNITHFNLIRSWANKYYNRLGITEDLLTGEYNKVRTTDIAKVLKNFLKTYKTWVSDNAKDNRLFSELDLTQIAYDIIGILHFAYKLATLEMLEFQYIISYLLSLAGAYYAIHTMLTPLQKAADEIVSSSSYIKSVFRDVRFNMKEKLHQQNMLQLFLHSPSVERLASTNISDSRLFLRANVYNSEVSFPNNINPSVLLPELFIISNLIGIFMEMNISSTKLLKKASYTFYNKDGSIKEAVAGDDLLDYCVKNNSGMVPKLLNITHGKLTTPQGYPTSPALANIVVESLKNCVKKELRDVLGETDFQLYVYADNILVFFNKGVSNSDSLTKIIIKTIKKVGKQHHLYFSDKKTYWSEEDHLFLGIALNTEKEDVRVTLKFLRKLNQIIINLNKKPEIVYKGVTYTRKDVLKLLGMSAWVKKLRKDSKYKRKLIPMEWVKEYKLKQQAENPESVSQ